MTADYVFNTQVKYIRKKYKVCGQFHDEVIIPLDNNAESKEKLSSYLKDCIDKTNQELKLNVELGISMDFGHSYADIH